MLLFPVGLPDSSSSAVTTAIEFRFETALAHELHHLLFIIYYILVFEKLKFLF